MRNPQAFPRDSWTEGMTLRDYFAGQALSCNDWSTYESLKEVAEDCYELADAMLKERAKE